MKLELFTYLFWALFFVGAYLLLRPSKRTSKDVLYDLKELDLEDQSVDLSQLDSEKLLLRLDDPYVKAGLFTNQEKRAFRKRTLFVWFCYSFFSFFIAQVLVSIPPAFVLFLSFAGFLMGYAVSKGMLERRAQKYKRSLEFFLPIVMERAVMAVEAGLDLLSGINSLIELEEKRVADKTKIDPVTRLFKIVTKLSHGGMPFDKALQEVSKHVDCVSVKHCFIHMGHSYKEGGELIYPLRELSDSTQAYFQETIEEEIAKLPVKATGPLAVVFVGLLVVMLTIPIMQVVDMTKNVNVGAPKTEEASK